MRIHAFLEKISRDYAGRSVLIVTHQVPYKAFRAQIQRVISPAQFRFKVRTDFFFFLSSSAKRKFLCCLKSLIVLFANTCSIESRPHKED